MTVTSDRDVRYHSSDDIPDEADTCPVAVAVRADGSIDVYGYIAIIDQRPAADHVGMLDQLYQADVLSKSAWLRARRKLTDR